MQFHLIRRGDFPPYADGILYRKRCDKQKNRHQISQKKLIHMTADPVQGRMSVGLKRCRFVGGVKKMAASVPPPRVWWLGRERSAELITAHTGGRRRHIARRRSVPARKAPRPSLPIH